MGMKVDNVGKDWVLLEDYTFEGGVVHEGFSSDGASIPTFAMRLFTHTDMNKMFIGSVIHDYCCKYKDDYKRKDASKLLVYYCKESGLGDKWYTIWKPYLVYYAVEIYQYFKGWR